ncbi:MAG: hypothetical protein IJ605_07160 [Prevotella sp.]|nr:hypothetical protein [Prevotella sp.]
MKNDYISPKVKLMNVGSKYGLLDDDIKFSNAPVTEENDIGFAKEDNFEDDENGYGWQSLWED